MASARVIPTDSAVMVAAFAANQTPGPYQTLGFRRDRPSGVLALAPGWAKTLVVTPFGVGGIGDTFGLRMVGLRPAVDAGRGGYNQIPLLELICTLGTGTGSAGSAVPETNRMVATVDDSTVGVEGIQFASLAAGQAATLLVDVQRCQEFFFEIGPGTATSGNVLVGSGPP